MEQLVEVYGAPIAIRIDNGPEMTAERFVDWANSTGIELRYIQSGKPNENAFIESFRSEVLDAFLLNSLDAAQEAADYWMTDTTKRDHVSPWEMFRQRNTYLGFFNGLGQ